MTERQTGATTRAMRDAPKGAVYIWPNSHLDYPKTLAAHLGRTDLRIERPDFLDYRLRGLTAPLVIDHAYNPNSEHCALIDQHAARMALREPKP